MTQGRRNESSIISVKNSQHTRPIILFLRGAVCFSLGSSKVKALLIQSHYLSHFSCQPFEIFVGKIDTDRACDKVANDPI